MIHGINNVPYGSVRLGLSHESNIQPPIGSQCGGISKKRSISRQITKNSPEFEFHTRQTVILDKIMISLLWILRETIWIHRNDSSSLKKLALINQKLSLTSGQVRKKSNPYWTLIYTRWTKIFSTSPVKCFFFLITQQKMFEVGHTIIS